MKNIRVGQKKLFTLLELVGRDEWTGPGDENMGFKIQGSDQNKNKSTSNCLKAGIKVFISHSKKNIKNATIIVKSSAIKNNNVELIYAKKRHTNLL